jgi:hypothetical protein
MVDTPVVIHQGENSSEYVVYKLLETIASQEGKVLHRATSSAKATAEKKWLLDTYAECLLAVRVPQSRR